MRKIKGIVYVIKACIPSQEVYKIGKTTNYQERKKWFTLQLPFDIEVITLIPSQNIHSFEKMLHKQFASKRIRGEWFALSTQDIQEIKAHENLGLGIW